MARKAIISGTGMYAPERVVPNSYFDELLGEPVDAWLRENVAIYERRWTEEGDSTADLAEQAARKALESAGIAPDALNLIVVATDTPEFVSPSTASIVQDRLVAKNAGTFDLNTACAGFVTALDLAAKYLIADVQYTHILVIGAYNMSRYLNLEDKKTVTLFADGAGAVVVSASEQTDRGFVTSMLESRGEYNEWMGIYAGGTRHPITQEVVAAKDHLLKFVRKFPKELNPEVWTRMARTLCERAGISPAEVDRFFITQINIHSIWETLDILGLPRERAETVMHHYGYTGSACIPMAFDQAIREGRAKPGDTVMFIGSGGGLAFAAALFKL